MIFGVVLVLTGVVWFLQSIGWVDSTIWNLYFPLVLVVFGLSILFASEEHACLMCKVMDRSEEKKPVMKASVGTKTVPAVNKKAAVKKTAIGKKTTSKKK